MNKFKINKNFIKKIIRFNISNSIKSLALLSIFHAISLMVGLLTTVVWTRWIPIETFGEYKIIISIISFAGAFCFLGIAQASLMSSVKKFEGNLLILISNKIYVNLIGSLFIIFLGSYFLLDNSKFSALFVGIIVAAIIFPIYNISDLWQSWLNGQEKFTNLAIAKFLTAMMALLSVVLIAIFDVTQLWLVILLFLILPAFQNLLILRKLVINRKNNMCDESIVSMSKHASFAMIFGCLLTMDIILLGRFYGVEEVALYSVALFFPEHIKGIYSIVGQVINPKFFSNKSILEIWSTFRINFLLITILFSIIGLIGFIFIPVLVEFLFSVKYEMSGIYSKWLWLSIACTGSFTYLGTALINTGRLSYIYAPNVGYPVCLMILFLIMINHGVWGMIIARSIGPILLAFYYSIAFYRELWIQKNKKIT